MKRAIWLTDIHLNFLGPAAQEAFLDNLAAREADAILLGGDVAEAPDVGDCLTRLGDRVACPVYFVLGNHDFYFGSIASVRARVADLSRRHPRLCWLGNAGVIELAAGVGLVGHDGWADARLGDYERSLVQMNDHRLIAEFVGISKRQRWDILRSLGEEAATYISRVLPEAADRYPQVFLLTHVPPFREACWYQGSTSGEDWLPHFTCHALGQAIVDVMRERPNKQLTVLCGHTHSPGETWPLPNVHVLTGGADYGAPRVQRVFEVGGET